MENKKELGNSKNINDIFILKDKPRLVKINVKDEEVHEKREDINKNILRNRKDNFVDTIKNYLGENYYIPSVLPIQAIRTRILELNKIEYNPEDLNKIKNGIDIIVEIYNEENILIDKIRVNEKNEYIENIKKQIDVLDIKKLIGD